MWDIVVKSSARYTQLSSLTWSDFFEPITTFSAISRANDTCGLFCINHRTLPITQRKFFKTPKISEEMNFSIFYCIKQIYKFYSSEFPYIYTAIYAQKSHHSMLWTTVTPLDSISWHIFVFYTLCSYLCVYYSTYTVQYSTVQTHGKWNIFQLSNIHNWTVYA